MADSIFDCHALARYLDDYLDIASVPDSKGALNGLQVASGSSIRRIAAAVDASERTIRGAIAADCQLLLVHHGLFWSGNRPITGRRYRRLKLLFDADVAVYSAHLPLDVHAEVGNNAQLARRLDLEPNGRFGHYQGLEVGLTAECDFDREGLRRRLESLLDGPVRLIPGGPDRIRRVGILSGGGGSMLQEAIAAGLDALITGEGSHHTFVDAMEGGLNLYYGGHYATETWGVRALTEHLAERFDVGWTFIDAPTGL